MTITIPAPADSPPAPTRASQTDLMRDLAAAIDHQALTPPTSIGFWDFEHAAVSLGFVDHAMPAIRHWVAYLRTRGCVLVEEFTGPPFESGPRGGRHYQFTASLDALDGWRVSLRTVVDQPAAGAL
jgi:sirohydrochlorin ferrochelatase